MRDSRKDNLVKPCDICGDVGFPEQIATCFQCKIAREHVYCMQTILIKIPEIWFCEVCRSCKGLASPKFVEQYRSPMALPSTTSEIVHTDTVGPSRHMEDSRRLGHHKKEVAIGTGKVKFISTAEAIKLSSGSRKVEYSSPRNLGSSHSRSATMVTMSKRTPVESKPAPPNVSLQKVKPNLNCRPIGHSKPPGHGSVELIPITRQQVSQSLVGLKDKRTACKDNYVCKEKSVDALISAEKVEISNSIVNKAVKFKPSPSMDALPIICSGGVLDTDVKPKSLDVQGSDLQILPRLEKYFPNYPALDATWCGSFEILDSVSHIEFYDGFRAHLPGKVHSKACEFSKQMPGVLLCTLLPCCNIWSEVFQNYHPNVNDIALYFFPGKFERSEQQYIGLLGLMEMQDLVLKSCINGVELLIFPSKMLHVNSWGLELKSFLWGVYCPVKSNLAVKTLLSCDVTSEAHGPSSNMKTKVKPCFSGVKMEQFNDSDIPPGFSRKAAGDGAVR